MISGLIFDWFEYQAPVLNPIYFLAPLVSITLVHGYFTCYWIYAVMLFLVITARGRLLVLVNFLLYKGRSEVTTWVDSHIMPWVPWGLMVDSM